jgi:hypothetical protein
VIALPIVIARPLVIATGMAAIFNLAIPAATYQDPRHRFEIRIPAGWTVEPFGEGVKLARGTAYCLMLEGQARDPENLVRRLVGQLSGQWTGFHQLNEGSATVDGLAAPYSFNLGINMKGVPAFLKVMAVRSQGTIFSLIESSAEKEFAGTKIGFEQIEQGLRFKPGQVPGSPR